MSKELVGAHPLLLHIARCLPCGLCSPPGATVFEPGVAAIASQPQPLPQRALRYPINVLKNVTTGREGPTLGNTLNAGAKHSRNSVTFHSHGVTFHSLNRMANV